MKIAAQLLLAIFAVFAVFTTGMPIMEDQQAPQQIGLTYGASPSEIVVTWASFTDAKVQGYVRFGTTPESLTTVVTAASQTYTLTDYTSPVLYEAKLSGLTSGNKKYFYQVGSDDTGYSEIFSFKSHPGVGSATSFHIFGDLGQTTNSENTLSELILQENSLPGTMSGGIVSMGDLSYANGDQPLWDSFGVMRQMAAANIPMFTTSGNHEWFDDAANMFTAYRARFSNPTVNGVKELYYSFDAGLVHWVMVAGYCTQMKTVYSQPCLAAGSEELAWLQADLAAVDRSTTPWVFVVFHQPYVNSNTAHSMNTEGAPMEDAIEDTLYNAKVDVVFSGHVHAYERSCQTYKYKCVDGAPYYITIGDGGNLEGLASTWINPQPSWSMFRQASYGFGEATVWNSTHVQWAWHQNQDLFPTVADSFWFIKGDTSSNKGVRGVTQEPVFADNARGLSGSIYNQFAVRDQAAKK